MPRLKRSQKSTCLIVCEGKGDKYFLHFLKYHFSNKNWKYTIEPAGGDPTSVVRRAIKMSAGFDKVYCLVDADRKLSIRPPKKINKVLKPKKYDLRIKASLMK